MSFRTAVFALSLILSSFAVAQQPKATAPTVPASTPIASQQTTQTVVIKELVKLKVPDSEVADAILFLEKRGKPDQEYTKFFTLYAIKDKALREHAALVLSFICHSMIGAVNGEFPGGGYYPIAHMEVDEKTKIPVFIPDRLVPGSDTLYWIDIREFNWTNQAWENMMKEEGYFAEPIVTHDKNGALRLLSGNAVVRGDWFITHASAITSQSDVDSKTKIYKEFLYGSLKAQPKNVAEFEKDWAIDTKKAREIGNVSSTLVTKSENVARHNRILFQYRTELGWYYRTYDVKNMRGKRDYGENILEFKGNPPTVFDGGEIFATNLLQMQVYDLYNQKEELVDFGDPTLVRHTSDVLADARVRTPHSCYDCHAAGPIPSENTLAEFIKARAKGYVYDPNDALRIKRTLLDSRFEDSIQENQQLFAKSLLKVNGLKPEENAKYYLESVSNYDKPLSFEQCAFECGMTPDTFKEAITEKSKIYPNKVPFRMGVLMGTGEGIPREIWESPGADGQPGLFQQTMIAINGLTAITYTTEAVPVVDSVKGNRVVAIKAGQLMTGSTVVKNYNEGEEFITDGKVSNGWIGVQSIDGKQTGYVRQDNVKFK